MGEPAPVVGVVVAAAVVGEPRLAVEILGGELVGEREVVPDDRVAVGVVPVVGGGAAAVAVDIFRDVPVGVVAGIVGYAILGDGAQPPHAASALGGAREVVAPDVAGDVGNIGEGLCHSLSL